MSKRKPIKTGTSRVIDAETGKVIEEKQNAMTMLPPAPGLCPECAVDHEYFSPHDQQSLYYQMQFHAKFGRWPTWTDAMAHCPAETRRAWRENLVKKMQEHGLEIPADLQGECKELSGQ